MQSVLNLVWDRLLPAIQVSATGRRSKAQMKLERKLAELSLRPQEGKGSSEAASRVLRQDL